MTDITKQPALEDGGSETSPASQREKLVDYSTPPFVLGWLGFERGLENRILYGRQTSTERRLCNPIKCVVYYVGDLSGGSYKCIIATSTATDDLKGFLCILDVVWNGTHDLGHREQQDLRHMLDFVVVFCHDYFVDEKKALPARWLLMFICLHGMCVLCGPVSLFVIFLSIFQYCAFAGRKYGMYCVSTRYMPLWADSCGDVPPALCLGCYVAIGKGDVVITECPSERFFSRGRDPDFSLGGYICIAEGGTRTPS